MGHIELGLYTFGDMLPGHGPRRMADLLEEIELADQLGLDVFGLGEHHRPEYVVSAPEVVLGAAAVRTKRIRLASAVTVLSSDDPVRVFQRFATVDLLSGGRAEIMAGRGSFIESFPLFGYDLGDYDTLFAEKLELLLKINEKETVSWQGRHRPSIANLGVYPRPAQDRLPIWLAVGGTPTSAVRAGTLGLPLALAIIGGAPEQFVPFVQLYRQTWEKAGHAPEQFQLGINSHVYVADTSQQATREFYQPYADMMNKIGQERGWSRLTQHQFDYMTSPRGALLVGSPQQVIDKILYERELFGNTRFLAQTSLGTLPHKQAMRSIELFGTVVAEGVRKEVRGEK